LKYKKDLGEERHSERRQPDTFLGNSDNVNIYQCFPDPFLCRYCWGGEGRAVEEDQSPRSSRLPTEDCAPRNKRQGLTRQPLTGHGFLVLGQFSFGSRREYRKGTRKGIRHQGTVYEIYTSSLHATQDIPRNMLTGLLFEQYTNKGQFYLKPKKPIK
jgi:hypothetical protein